MEDKEIWDKVWSGNVRAKYPNTIVVNTILNLKIKDSLELGAGTGNDIIELHKKGIDITFSDNSLVAINEFRKRTQNKIKTINLDVLKKFPYKDCSFDLVYSLGLLEHFDKNQRGHIIREMFRVSRKYVLIDVPQRYSFLTIIKKTLMFLGRWKYGWETEFSYGQLVREVNSMVCCSVLSKYGRGFLPLPRTFKERFSNNLIEKKFNNFYVILQKKTILGLFNSIGVVFEK